MYLHASSVPGLACFLMVTSDLKVASLKLLCRGQPALSLGGAGKQEAPQEATVQACLAAFFQAETIQWECPAEADARRASRSSSWADALPVPVPGQGQAEHRRRTVSFSGACDPAA